MKFNLVDDDNDGDDDDKVCVEIICLVSCK
jgi:hypothetical protein